MTISLFFFVLLPYVIGVAPFYVVACITRNRRPHAVDVLLFVPIAVPLLLTHGKSMSNVLLELLCGGAATGLTFLIFSVVLKREYAVLQVLAAMLIASGAAFLFPHVLPRLHD
ncbi:MAG: hypothetical protein K2X32_02690 [Phycisphaerales bacterium]|nr:hypothetical protein [Phycisphaerales bacterium]